MSKRKQAVATILLSLRRWKNVVPVLACLMQLGAPQPLHALFTIEYNGTEIQLATGTLTNPSGLALDLAGNLYIADYDNTANASTQILKVFPNGSVSRLDNNGSLNGVGALKAAHHLKVDSAGTCAPHCRTALPGFRTRSARLQGLLFTSAVEAQ